MASEFCLSSAFERCLGRGAPGWLGGVSAPLLISARVVVPGVARSSPWGLLEIFSFPPPLPCLCSLSLSLSLSLDVNKETFKIVWAGDCTDVGDGLGTGAEGEGSV